MSTMIHVAMVKLMAEVGVVGKNQSTSFGERYSYRGIDDVMAALQPALVKCGIVVVPEVLEQHLGEYTTEKGSVMQHAILKVKYTFYAEDGSSVSAIVMGEGADKGDKSVNKAMSGAMKYAITQALSIPTKETKDSEADEAVGTEGRARSQPAASAPRRPAPPVKAPRGAAKAALLPLDQVLEQIGAADSVMALSIIYNQQTKDRNPTEILAIKAAATDRKGEIEAAAPKDDDVSQYL